MGAPIGQTWRVGVGYNTRGFRLAPARNPSTSTLMTHGTPDETLTPDIAQRLTDFARACKAATRSVTLYPDGHPATSVALSRLVESAAPRHRGRTADDHRRARTGSPWTAARRPRPDSAIVRARQPAARSPGRRDCALVERRPTRRRGAASCCCSAGRPRSCCSKAASAACGRATGGQHLQIREIDYAEVLRERKSGIDAAWDIDRALLPRGRRRRSRRGHAEGAARDRRRPGTPHELTRTAIDEARPRAAACARRRARSSVCCG